MRVSAKRLTNLPTLLQSVTPFLLPFVALFFCWELFGGDGDEHLLPLLHLAAFPSLVSAAEAIPSTDDSDFLYSIELRVVDVNHAFHLVVC
jgi:hypothetical protein